MLLHTAVCSPKEQRTRPAGDPQNLTTTSAGKSSRDLLHSRPLLNMQRPQAFSQWTNVKQTSHVNSSQQSTVYVNSQRMSLTVCWQAVKNTHKHVRGAHHVVVNTVARPFQARGLCTGPCHDWIVFAGMASHAPCSPLGSDMSCARPLNSCIASRLQYARQLLPVWSCGLRMEVQHHTLLSRHPSSP